MEDSTIKHINVPGLSDSGTVKPDAGAEEIEELMEHLGVLSTKADIALVMAAAEIGCNEHTEVITVEVCARIVGLHIFSGVLVSYISEQPLLQQGESVIKELAQRVRQEMKLLESACKGVIGLSEKGKKTFQNSVTEFVIQTFAANLPGFTTGVSQIIKRHG